MSESIVFPREPEDLDIPDTSSPSCGRDIAWSSCGSIWISFYCEPEKSTILSGTIIEIELFRRSCEEDWSISELQIIFIPSNISIAVLISEKSRIITLISIIVREVMDILSISLIFSGIVQIDRRTRIELGDIKIRQTSPCSHGGTSETPTIIES